jgi:hypothetical protein
MINTTFELKQTIKGFKMDINDLTIGQAKELSKLFGESTTQSNVPVELGQAYLFRTVTHIELGRVESVCGNFITLSDASWIADTGRYHDALKNGTLNEIEPYVDGVTINAGSLIGYTKWSHDLPTEQK